MKILIFDFILRKRKIETILLFDFSKMPFIYTNNAIVHSSNIDSIFLSDKFIYINMNTSDFTNTLKSTTSRYEEEFETPEDARENFDEIMEILTKN